MTYSFDLVTKNGDVAGETAKILKVLVQLVHFYILKLVDRVNMPIGVADVVFSKRVFNQVDLVFDFDGIGLRNDDHLTQLAEQVFVVWMP